MDAQERIEHLQELKQYAIAAQSVLPLLAKRKQIALELLLRDFRAGEKDLLVRAATLSAYAELEQEFKTKRERIQHPHGEIKMSDMLKEVGKVNEEAKLAASGQGGSDETAELPEGASPLEARSEDAEVEGEAGEKPEAPAEPAVEAAAEEETLIRIGTETFKTQREAIAYAERLEREKLAAEAYNQGIRDTITANSGSVSQPAAEPEDNFEERFYANPKETLKEIQSRARDEAVAAIRAENQREAMWSQFLAENPDIRRKDAERVLQENWDTLGKMTDLDKAKKVLAQRVRSEYEEIRDLARPRTELSNKRGPVSPPSGGAPARVTPERKSDRPLSFAEEMRSMRK